MFRETKKFQSKPSCSFAASVLAAWNLLLATIQDYSEVILMMDYGRSLADIVHFINLLTYLNHHSTFMIAFTVRMGISLLN